MCEATTSAKLLDLRRSVFGLYWLIASLVLGPCWCHPAISPQHPESKKRPTAENRGAPPRQARRDFETRCSACHGLDGRGGEHAPNIATNPTIRQLPDSELFRIVHDGIIAKGMPAFDYLPEWQIKSIVSYLRSLASLSGVGFSRGNAARGQDFFFGKAGCGGCHMMHGKGGFLGADLTENGAPHGRRGARENLLDPSRFYALHQSALNKSAVEVVTRQGERLTGVIRNEDNFSLQLLGADGTFHMLMKSDVERVNRNTNVIPPADSATRLSLSELEDVVSYLGQDTRGTARESAVTIGDPRRKSSSARHPHH